MGKHIEMPSIKHIIKIPDMCRHSTECGTCDLVAALGRIEHLLQSLDTKTAPYHSGPQTVTLEQPKNSPTNTVGPSP